MKFEFGCELSYTIGAPTLFICNLEAARIDSHRDHQETLAITPEVARSSHTQPDTGNRYFSFVAPEGPLTLRYEASADLHLVRADSAEIAQVPIAEVPLEHFQYLLPSRFSPSDKLANFAVREFGSLPPGHSRVTAICNWIYEHIAYRHGSTDAATSALDVVIERSGVCRDFAHLGVAFCRALGIPARFTSCYAHGLEPADFHAVFEAYLDGHWWLFDATRQASLDGLVRIGTGRDAADVSFSTVYGGVEQTGMRVWMVPSEGELVPAERTTDAVRAE